ncbi:MAG: hypothetical protein PUC06_09195, partial [Oscillospiraceae bacterium]|nr:hypothetical protein [Oscillospiraceae bacterium]
LWDALRVMMRAQNCTILNVPFQAKTGLRKQPNVPLLYNIFPRERKKGRKPIAQLPPGKILYLQGVEAYLK